MAIFLEVVCHIDGCFLLDSCWRCGALLSPLSQAVPCTEFLCVKCGAPFARAPSLCPAETIPDEAMAYSELDRLAYSFSPDFIGILAEDYIDALSAGDLRGTNPTNPADRHIAVILEAGRLRQAGLALGHLLPSLKRLHRTGVGVLAAGQADLRPLRRGSVLGESLQDRAVQDDPALVRSFFRAPTNPVAPIYAGSECSDINWRRLNDAWPSQHLPKQRHRNRRVLRCPAAHRPYRMR